jgi:adhesin transport system membrane fusion protein
LTDIDVKKKFDLFKINPSLRAGAWLIMLLLSAAIVWAYFARLDEVVIASGVVAPQEQIKVIQHLEGGILDNIYVHEGDFVKRGQTLLKLTLGIGRISREEKQAELDALRLTRLRLLAQLNNEQPIFPETLVKLYPDIISAENLAYDSLKRKQVASVKAAQARIEQKKLEISELKAKLSAAYREIGTLKEQFEISTELLDKGLTSKLEHLQLRSSLERLRGDISVLKQTIPKAEKNHQQAIAEKAEMTEKFQNTLSTQLNKTEQMIARITELLSQANDQNLRTEIKSPIDGIVKKMRYNTLQGVVKPGEAIMEIVPQSDNLIIKGQLNPSDRGYINKGQSATVKITTYDYSRYGGLEGKVMRISADSMQRTNNTMNTGAPVQSSSYYEVDIKTEKNHLGATREDLPITPGMEASIEIHTGTRTVLEYLLKPLLRIKNEAFREY